MMVEHYTASVVKSREGGSDMRRHSERISDKIEIKSRNAKLHIRKHTKLKFQYGKFNNNVTKKSNNVVREYKLDRKIYFNNKKKLNQLHY